MHNGLPNLRLLHHASSADPPFIVCFDFLLVGVYKPFLLPYIVRCNPYCEVTVDGQKGNIRTDVKKKTSTPEWDEEFTMYVKLV